MVAVKVWPKTLEDISACPSERVPHVASIPTASELLDGKWWPGYSSEGLLATSGS